MAISLEGRTALVTCGAQGMGRATAERLLAAGARVMLAETHDKGETTLEGDPERWARFPYVAEDRLATQNLLAATAERFDRIDILVNAARPAPVRGRFLDLGNSDFDAAMGGMVRAVFQLSQAVARRMIETRRESEPAGAIVNVTSIAARRTLPGLLAHSVACAALDQLTRSMAASLAREAVRVNAVALGGVLTEGLMDEVRENAELRDDLIRVTPLGRLAEMAEAAEVVMWLASESASFVTGQIVSVDGGRTLLDPLG